VKVYFDNTPSDTAETAIVVAYEVGPAICDKTQRLVLSHGSAIRHDNIRHWSYLFVPHYGPTAG
jgi:hypothetical protein